MSTKSDEVSSLSGKTVVFTGALKTLTRAKAAALAKSEGKVANVSTSISSKVDVVICGSDAGQKLTQARGLGVPVISEEEFLSLVSEQQSRRPTGTSGNGRRKRGREGSSSSEQSSDDHESSASSFFDDPEDESASGSENESDSDDGDSPPANPYSYAWKEYLKPQFAPKHYRDVKIGAGKIKQLEYVIPAAVSSRRRKDNRVGQNSTNNDEILKEIKFSWHVTDENSGFTTLYLDLKCRLFWRSATCLRGGVLHDVTKECMNPPPQPGKTVYDRQSRGEGLFTLPTEDMKVGAGGGTLYFEFDNTFSWFTEKTVDLTITPVWTDESAIVKMFSEKLSLPAIELLPKVMAPTTATATTRAGRAGGSTGKRTVYGKWCSKIGGLADWPADMEYPTVEKEEEGEEEDDDGSAGEEDESGIRGQRSPTSPLPTQTRVKMPLLAQINFGHFPRLEHYPTKGVLQIFWNPYVTQSSTIVSDYYEYDSDSRDHLYEVVFHEDPDAVTNFEKLSWKDSGFPYEGLSFFSTPETCFLLGSRLIPNDPMNLADCRQHRSWNYLSLFFEAPPLDSAVEARLKSVPGPLQQNNGCKIGGFGTFSAGDLRAPTNLEYIGHEGLLLLQISSINTDVEGAKDYLDFGPPLKDIQFTIDLDSLKKREFTKETITLCCGVKGGGEE